MKEFKHFINGEFVGSKSGRKFDNINPANNEKIGIVHEGGEYEVNMAVEAARKALEGEWGYMKVEDRMARLHKVADLINERFDEFLENECLDTGKPKWLAGHIDIPRGAANFKIFADAYKNVPTESFMTETPDGFGAVNYSQRKPKGVIAVISPWNLPLLLMTWKVGPALACGNTVIVKPSEETPRTATLLAEVMNEAGIPPGVYNVVHGFGPESAGSYLTGHPDIDGITFTGETKTGAAILKNSADYIRHVSFELGGKNPAIVFADADMDAAIEGTMRSVFGNCGQVCLGTERVYVERPVFDEFVTRLKQGAEMLRYGKWDDPDTGIGPLVSQEHKNKVMSYYKKAKEAGANIIIGGGEPKDLPEDIANGFWVEPTIWTGLKEDDVVVKEEIFGPVCHIQPFDTEEEVIKMANDTPYGLAAAIWTQDSAKTHRVARKIDAGLIWVNEWFLRDLRTPFGGMKASGIGREGGVHSLEFYTELKNICIKL
jgi:aminomuconate-semialdehyde/2-hydroxymuconate-6-semialdehyde dehydrogenase